VTLALYVALSRNKKLGLAAATYLSVKATCPDSCRLKDGGGCYAEDGRVLRIQRRLDDGEGDDIDAAAEEFECVAASAIYHGLPLRLGVSGDSKTETAAKIRASTAYLYHERGGGPVWGYTHSWREIRRFIWGGISMLASCETWEEVFEANDRSYVAAIVLPAFEFDEMGVNPHLISIGGRQTLAIRCPNQVKGTACSECRLCLNDNRLQGKTIVFRAHGTRKATLEYNLVQLRRNKHWTT
jgi:hypothetical protein